MIKNAVQQAKQQIDISINGVTSQMNMNVKDLKNIKGEIDTKISEAPKSIDSLINLAKNSVNSSITNVQKNMNVDEIKKQIMNSVSEVLKAQGSFGKQIDGAQNAIHGSVRDLKQVQGRLDNTLGNAEEAQRKTDQLVLNASAKFDKAFKEIENQMAAQFKLLSQKMQENSAENMQKHLKSAITVSFTPQVVDPESGECAKSSGAIHEFTALEGQRASHSFMTPGSQ